MAARPGLFRTAARTAVLAGIATSVARRIKRRQENKLAAAATPGTQDDGLVASLQRLADLKASGALTDTEYAAAKARLLG